MVVCEYEHPNVRVLLNCARMSDPKFGTLIDSPRERWARWLLDLAFAIRASSSYSLTLFVLCPRRICECYSLGWKQFWGEQAESR